jgi:hypothetical protein
MTGTDMDELNQRRLARDVARNLGPDWRLDTTTVGAKAVALDVLPDGNVPETGPLKGGVMTCRICDGTWNVSRLDGLCEDCGVTIADMQPAALRIADRERQKRAPDLRK